MNKMKRIFSFLLVLSMILGSFAATFTVAHAADVEKADKELTKVPKDVIGTEYEKAISRLVAFGIVEGYPDGTFKPANEVTRAEFAKILIEALGIGNATKAATGNTKFSDVPASHWASGYINVASGQGLIKGYNNGTFQPEKKVSYAEALTMLVRALGYQDNFLKGTWPGNYVAKAAEAGITAGVKFDSAVSSANRGDVAVLVNNTLDGDVVKVETYKDGTVEYKETEVTLLKDKLDISKYEDTRVIADKIVNDGLDEDEITVLFLKDIDKKETKSVRKDYKEGDEKDFRITKSVNSRKLIGEEVSIYMDNKDKVVYIEVENDDKAYFDFVEALDGKDGEIKELSLVRFDKDYQFAKDAQVYVFEKDQYKEKAVDKDGTIDASISDVLGKVGKFVVKNNKVVYAEIMGVNETSPWMLVRKNEKGLLEGINEEDEEFDLDLTEDGNYDGVFVFDTLGNKLDVKDIKEGNILYAQKQDYEGDDYAVVVAVQNNVLEGKLTRVKEDRVGIGSKEVKVIRYNDGQKRYDQVFYSVEGYEDVKVWDKDSSDWEKDMEDADEEDVIAYLDVTGKIAFLATQAKGTAGYKYGVVTKAFADNDRVKVYAYIDGKDGKEITYKVEKEKTMTSAKVVDKIGDKVVDHRKVKDGDVIKFKLNRAGEIAEDELYVMNPENFWVMQEGKDFGKDSIPSTFQNKDGEKKSFAIDNKAIIIDAEGLEPGTTKFDVDDFGIAKWEDMAEDNHNSKLKFFIFTKRNKTVDVDAIIFVGDEGASTSSDEEAIYVINKHQKSGDVYVKYVSYKEGKVEEIQVDKLIKSDGESKTSLGLTDIDKERPYVAKMKSSSKIELHNKGLGDLTYVAGIVATKRGNVITLEGSKEEYKLSSGAVVYEEDTKKSTSNIGRGDAVYFIVENDVNIRVIERVVSTGDINKIKDGKNPYETKATIVKPDGTTTPGEVGEDGVITYINSDKTRMRVNNVNYTLDENTELYDSSKKLIALGASDVKAKNNLNVNDGVKNIEVKNGVVVSLMKVATSDQKLVVAKEAVTALETAAAESDLATNETNLIKAEAKLADAQTAVSALAAGTDKTDLQAKVTTAKATVETARENFTETKVVALETAAAESDLATNETNLIKAEKAVKPAEDSAALVKDATKKAGFEKRIETAKKRVTDARAEFGKGESETAAETAVSALEAAVLGFDTTEPKIIAAEKLVKPAEDAVAKVADEVKKAGLNARIVAEKAKIQAARVAFDKVLKAINEAADKFDMKTALEENKSALGITSAVSVEKADYVFTKRPAGGYKTGAAILDKFNEAE